MGLPDQESASHPLFNPPEPETDVGSLREGTNWLWDLTGRIIGRSGNMRTVITGAAVEFTELVTSDITDGGHYNDTLWRETCMNIAFAAGVGDQWADDVIDYKSDRAKLIADFKTALDAGRSVSGEVATTVAESKRRANLIRQYETMAQTRLDELHETGRERKRMLKDGPEPVHVKKLVDAGILGWTAYNIMGPGSNPPLPVDPREADDLADALNRFVHSGTEPDQRYMEIITALSAITNKALALQGRGTPNSGEKLRAEEIEFLKRFYARLDDTNTKGWGHGSLLYLPKAMDDNKLVPWDDQEKEELLGALGNGLLVLSNPEVGGSSEALPPSMRRFAEGHPSSARGADGVHIGDDAEDWMADAEQMARFFGPESASHLRGGEKFSANIATSAGHHLNGIDNDRGTWNDPLSTLLDVTGRNEQASHRILSNEHDHPRFDKNANALKGLFTHEWGDSGAAVAKLTGWIPDAAQSDDEHMQKIARESALGLIEMLTANDERRQALLDTGITVHTDGKEVTNAAFGLVNPRIAESLGDVALAYLGELSDPEPQRGGGFRIDDDDDRMEMPYENRQDFFEYIMADESAATKLYTAANSMDMMGVQNVVHGPKDGLTPSTVAGRNSTLRALLDSALIAESLDRTDDDLTVQKLEQQSRDRWLAIVRTAGYAATGYAGTTTRIATSFFGTGVAFSEYNLRVNQQAAEPNYQELIDPRTKEGEAGVEHPYAPNGKGQTYRDSNVDYKSKLDALDVLVRNRDVKASTIEQVAPDLIDDNGDVITYYKYDASDRESAGNTVSTGLSELAENKNDEGGDRKTIQDALGNAKDYSQAYKSRYEEVWEQLYARVNLQDQKQADSD
ncbi:hypothetical protein GCM10027570_50850 [Streptomonospora sediminis]